jgi:hypothetical protein
VLASPAKVASKKGLKVAQNLPKIEKVATKIGKSYLGEPFYCR